MGLKGKRPGLLLPVFEIHLPPWLRVPGFVRLLFCGEDAIALSFSLFLIEPGQFKEISAAHPLLKKEVPCYYTIRDDHMGIF